MLTRMEELLLLAVWNLQDEAYSLSIRRLLSDWLDKNVSVGSVYVPLERMAERGLLVTRESDPTPVRGGRRKRFYRLTPEGLAALKAVKRVHETAWADLPTLAFPQ